MRPAQCSLPEDAAQFIKFQYEREYHKIGRLNSQTGYRVGFGFDRVSIRRTVRPTFFFPSPPSPAMRHPIRPFRSRQPDLLDFRFFLRIGYPLSLSLSLYFRIVSVLAFAVPSPAARLQDAGRNGVGSREKHVRRLFRYFSLTAVPIERHDDVKSISPRPARTRPTADAPTQRRT